MSANDLISEQEYKLLNQSVGAIYEKKIDKSIIKWKLQLNLIIEKNENGNQANAVGRRSLFLPEGVSYNVKSWSITLTYQRDDLPPIVGYYSRNEEDKTKFQQEIALSKDRPHNVKNMKTFLRDSEVRQMALIHLMNDIQKKHDDHAKEKDNDSSHKKAEVISNLKKEFQDFEFNYDAKKEEFEKQGIFTLDDFYKKKNPLFRKVTVPRKKTRMNYSKPTSTLIFRHCRRI